MEIHELREELITYIHLADEEKLQALSTLLLDKNENEECKWWDDEAFIAELKDEERKIKSGDIKGYTEEEANAIFRARLDKRKLEHV